MGCRVLVGDRGYIMQMVSCGPNNVIIVFASCIMCKRLLVLSQNTYYDTFSSCIILYPAMLLWDIGAICESATSFLAGFSPHLHTSSFSSLLFPCNYMCLADVEWEIPISIANIFVKGPFYLHYFYSGLGLLIILITSLVVGVQKR